MKKFSIIFALMMTVMFVAQYAAADIEEGQLHFTPKIGYMDPRAQSADGSFIGGGVVSYQWDYHHEVGLGFLLSDHDVDDTLAAAAGATGSDAKSLIWGLGYKYHFDSTRRSQHGHWTLGLDVQSHRIKFAGEKSHKIGANINLGYEWKEQWVAEIGYLFAGTDDNTPGTTQDDTRLGGFSVLVGYKF